MPKELKEFYGERLNKRGEEIGVPDLASKIADETICTDDNERLVEFLTEVGHPVLGLEPLM
jgi:acetyl-CoA synthase